MIFFHHIPHLTPIDPLGDGLGDDIAAEQAEPDHITLDERIDTIELNKAWDVICDDLKKDPMWYSEE